MLSSFEKRPNFLSRLKNIFRRNPEKEIKNYKIIKELGRGSFGKVVSAINTKTGEKVAIKIQLSNRNSDLFEEEIDILKKVSKYCDNLVCIKDSGIIKGGMHYIIMDYAEGMNLSDYVYKYDITLESSLFIINQIIETVNILHTNGIAHSDIKPENIQVDPINMKVKILDLGLACDVQDEKGYCGGGGTRMFLPEKFNATLKGRKSTDIYAIGMTLLMMIANYSDEDTADILYSLIGRYALNIRKIRKLVDKEYLDNPHILYILKFLSKSEKTRLSHFKNYIKMINKSQKQVRKRK